MHGGWLARVVSSISFHHLLLEVSARAVIATEHAIWIPVDVLGFAEFLMVQHSSVTSAVPPVFIEISNPKPISTGVPSFRGPVRVLRWHDATRRF
jgi:hypothetical protein